MQRIKHEKLLLLEPWELKNMIYIFYDRKYSLGSKEIRYHRSISLQLA
jgi:hypothetical protein